MKKINIFVNGTYICSTMRARTCREAVARFLADPCYMGRREAYGQQYTGMVKADIDGAKVRAYFEKGN